MSLNRQDACRHFMSAGSSVSATSPAIATTAGQTLIINLNADGAQTITLAANSTAVSIAADIQAKVHALTAVTPANQTAFSSLICVSNLTGQYALISGLQGATSAVVVSGGTAAVALKLGVVNGGAETVGVFVRCLAYYAAAYAGKSQAWEVSTLPTDLPLAQQANPTDTQVSAISDPKATTLYNSWVTGLASSAAPEVAHTGMATVVVP